jgi:hypothetical protein
MKHSLFRRPRLPALVASLALALAAPHAAALNPYTYQSSLTGGTYTASASYYSASSTISSADLAASSGLRSLVLAAQNYYISTQDSINSAIATQAATVTEASVRLLYPGILNGTLTATVTGLPNGNLAVSIGGLRYNAQLRTNGSTAGGLLSFSCTTNLALTPMGVSMEYNPYTGAVSNAAPAYTASQSTTCSNSLGWVPLLGSYINGKIEAGVASVATAMNASSGQLLSVQPQQALLGFVNAINPNTYMIGNVDAGMYLKNNIQSLYIGKQISLRIQQPAYFFAPTWSNNRPGPSQYSGNAFSVNFYDSGVQVAGFNVNLTQYFSWTLVGGGEE